MEPQPKLLYTKREAAQLLSLSVRSIDYLITSCEIASRRVGRRVLIHRDAIERFARQDHFAIRERRTARPAELDPDSWYLADPATLDCFRCRISKYGWCIVQLRS